MFSKTSNGMCWPKIMHSIALSGSIFGWRDLSVPLELDRYLLGDDIKHGIFQNMQ